jgi:hypothetical protein
MVQLHYYCRSSRAMEVHADLSGSYLGFLEPKGGSILPKGITELFGTCGLLRYFREAVAKGINNQFETIGYLEFRKNGAEVVRDCSFTDKQSLPDLLVF